MRSNRTVDSDAASARVARSCKSPVTFTLDRNMSDARIKRFQSVLRDVNALLYEQWAPIGFVGALPKDEYESYAMRVVSMLAAGTSENEIAAYLATTAQAITGYPSDQLTAAAVARRLMQFKEAARAIAV